MYNPPPLGKQQKNIEMLGHTEKTGVDKAAVSIFNGKTKAN